MVVKEYREVQLEEATTEKVVRSIETGWSYVVLVCCYALLSIAYGIVFSVAPLILPWAKTFEKDLQVIGWSSSINMACLFFAGLPTTYMLKYFSHRTLAFTGLLLAATGMTASYFATNIYFLYVTYGLITGGGFGMVNTMCVTFPAFYFDKHRDLALGMVTAGLGLGTIIFPQTYTLFIEIHSWRAAMLWTGAISLQALPLTMLLRPPNKPKVEAEDINQNVAAAGEGSEDWSVLKELNFWLVLISINLWNTGALIALAFLSSFAQANGMSGSQGSLLVTAVGFSYLVTTILMSLVSGFIPFSRIQIENLGTLIRGLSLILLPLFPTFMFSISCTTLYGIGFALEMAMFFPHMVEVCGIEKLQNVAGLVIFSLGIGTVIGPPLAGWLYVISEAYTLPFVSGGVMVVLGIIPLYVVYIRLYTSCGRK